MVEEVLEFNARMRLEASLANNDALRSAYVDELVVLLELDPIRRRAAGNLSSGEAKRLSIGVALVSNPSILFLDEPTTGLDARSTAQVMRVLRNAADTGRTIVCTIHQPSYALFSAFDDLLLLAPGGHQVYGGALGEHCSQLIDFF